MKLNYRIDYSDEVEELIEQIKINLNQLEKLTSKQLLPSFTDRSNEEKEIDQLTHQITRQFRKSQVLIGKIGETQYQPTKDQSQQKTKEIKKMIQNVQVGLMTKIQELSQTFQKRQRFYLQHLKSSEIDSNHTILNIPESDQQSPRTQSFSQQQQQQQSVKSNQIDLQQRDREIEGITQSILELSEMFKDLSTLVIDQGTMLDRIDYHVEEMSRDLKGTVHELKIANKHSNRSGKCRLIFLLIILIFAAILLLIFKPHHQSLSNPNQNQNQNTIDHPFDSKSSSTITNKLIKPRSKLKQRWKD
ncbi:t-SNARE [Melampsora americana]|nr:t-SNARE [Melampsora americana]